MATSSMDVVCEITGSIQRCNDPVRTYSFFITDIAIVVITAVVVYKFLSRKYES